jgi:hypothetical protein
VAFTVDSALLPVWYKPSGLLYLNARSIDFVRRELFGDVIELNQSISSPSLPTLVFVKIPARLSASTQLCFCPSLGGVKALPRCSVSQAPPPSGPIVFWEVNNRQRKTRFSDAQDNALKGALDTKITSDPLRFAPLLSLPISTAACCPSEYQQTLVLLGMI